jgi:hypothetical protein
LDSWRIWIRSLAVMASACANVSTAAEIMRCLQLSTCFLSCLSQARLASSDSHQRQCARVSCSGTRVAGCLPPTIVLSSVPAVGSRILNFARSSCAQSGSSQHDAIAMRVLDPVLKAVSCQMRSARKAFCCEEYPSRDATCASRASRLLKLDFLPVPVESEHHLSHHHKSRQPGRFLFSPARCGVNAKLLREDHFAQRHRGPAVANAAGVEDASPYRRDIRAELHHFAVPAPAHVSCCVVCKGRGAAAELILETRIPRASQSFIE